MSSSYRQRHSQAADDENQSVGRAKRRVHEVAGGGEGLRVHAAINRIGAKHTAEEHDFRQQEHPHSEGGGIELLVHVIEVMTQMRRMVGCYGVISQRAPPRVSRMRRLLRLRLESRQN